MKKFITMLSLVMISMSSYSFSISYLTQTTPIINNTDSSRIKNNLSINSFSLDSLLITVQQINLALARGNEGLESAAQRGITIHYLDSITNLQKQKLENYILVISNDSSIIESYKVTNGILELDNNNLIEKNINLVKDNERIKRGNKTWKIATPVAAIIGFIAGIILIR